MKRIILLMTIVLMVPLAFGQSPTLTNQSPDFYVWIPDVACISGDLLIQNNTEGTIEIFGIGTRGLTNNSFPMGYYCPSQFANPEYWDLFSMWVDGEPVEIEVGISITAGLSGDLSIEIPSGESVNLQVWATFVGSCAEVCIFRGATDVFYYDDDGNLGILYCYGPAITVYNSNPLAIPTIPPESEEVVDSYALSGAYPNPFNPTTTISFALPAPAHVNLTVYDLSGRKVAQLVNGWRVAGMHEVNFDGSNLPSGVYVYRLQAGDFNANGKMALMK